MNIINELQTEVNFTDQIILIAIMENVKNVVQIELHDKYNHQNELVDKIKIYYLIIYELVSVQLAHF